MLLLIISEDVLSHLKIYYMLSGLYFVSSILYFVSSIEIKMAA